MFWSSGILTGNQTSFVQKRLVLGRQQRTLATHVKDNKLVRQYRREKAYGVGTQPRALRVSFAERQARSSASSFVSETGRAKNAAMSAFSKAKAVEPKTTSVLQGIAQSTSSQLAGLEFKQKSVESLLRKMKADAALKGTAWKTVRVNLIRRPGVDV